MRCTRGSSLAPCYWSVAALALVGSFCDKALAEDSYRADSSGYNVRQVLLNLYQATGGLDWTRSDNWFQQGDDICDWYGIVCYSEDPNLTDDRRNGHIQKIDLSKNRLVGTVPPEIFELPYLESLVLEDNRDLDFDLSQIQQAQFLKHLDISSTSVRNIASLVDAPQLETLHITDLNLRGSIPQVIYQLTNLLALFANDNGFTGTISTLIGSLTSLDEIYLFNNALTGQIPTQIGYLSRLEIMSLGGNGFGGSLPTELNRLTDLQTLAIQRNNDWEEGPGISGPLPSLMDLTQIKEIYLQNQRLNGALDQDFILNAPAAALIKVDLSSNMITGNVPSSLQSKEYLNLNLADNRIRGVSSSLYDTSSNSCSNIRNWMGSDVSDIGCDAFLCPPGTWAPLGRATNSDSCQSCSDDSTYWGRTSCDATTTTSTQQREILVSFYNQMGGRNWKDDTNWLDFDESICDWHGVDCTNDGKVKSISLSNNGLTGTPPDELFELDELMELVLSSNTITFSFTGIAKLINLRRLDLADTGLSNNALGDLDELKSLSNLDYLSLANNDLRGTIPSALFEIASLEDLLLSQNEFSGQLSSRISQLTNLKRFGCDGNQLTGQLTTFIGSMVSLQEFLAAENSFEGTLPEEFDNLRNLEILSLHQAGSDKGIGGSLPPFRNMRQLTSLQLDSNKLDGSLPSDLLSNSDRLDRTVDISLSNNLLDGGIPIEWSRFQKLSLDLTGNQITDIPSSLCSQSEWMDGLVGLFGCDAILCPKGTYNELGRVSGLDATCESCSAVKNFGAKSCGGDLGGDESSELYILRAFFFSTQGENWKDNRGWTDSEEYCNDFTGVTCDNLGRVTQIVLPSNGLTGTPDPLLFKLTRLQVLDLSGNQIDFSFDGIGNAERLSKLYLADIGLDSVQGIADATSLVELRLQDNNLRGEIPPQLFSLTGLRELDLSTNQLSGDFPDRMTSWRNIEVLRMYHNFYTGQLPVLLSKLTTLKELNLAENNFDGTIPPEFNDLTSLEFLSLQREGGIVGDDDIGINQGDSSVLGTGLTGTLPAFDALQSIKKLFLGLNSLSGSIPYEFIGGVRDKNSQVDVDLTSNRLTGTIPASLTEFESLSIYVADNRIEAIADGICFKTGWMQGDVGRFGCDGILCPAGSNSLIGRESGQRSCQQCSSGTNAYMGSFECLSESQQSGNSERSILEKMYEDMNGYNWFYYENWMDPDESICSWYGIECIADDVESVMTIHLMENNLIGALTTQLYSLPNLQELNLRGNRISFSAQGISNARQLELIDLEDCGIGKIDNIDNAPSLKVLRVDNNNFTSFPTDVFGLSRIEVLSMSGNEGFEDQTVPQQIRSLGNLVYFDCGGCSFTGEIPTWLGDMSTLEYLGLQQNALSGSLPSELQNMMALKHLDFTDQKSSKGGLTGNMLSFSNQTSLTEILLSHNVLTGELPTDLLRNVNLNELITIDLRFNFLNGTIPTELGRIRNLDLLLAANTIAEIPEELCSLPWNDGNTAAHGCDGILCAKGSFNAYGRAIGDLACITCDTPFEDVLGNTACGVDFEHTILVFMYRDLDGPNWKRNTNWLENENHCSWEGITCYGEGGFNGMVKEIDLEDNNMVGSTWAPIWQLVGLSHVNLRRNKINVSFLTVSDTVNLQTLILSETDTNSLVGISGAINLKKLHLESAGLAGSIPDEIFLMTTLEELYLGYNKLTGTISTQIGDLRSLRDLYLFENDMSGTLPTELGRLASLEHLSLGLNRFAGTIPRQMTSLPLLEVLSLQGESGPPPNAMFSVGTGSGMTGDLPAFDNLPKIRELYLGDNSFEGTIPDHFLAGVRDKSGLITVDLSDNFLSGDVPRSLASFDNLNLLLPGNVIHGIPQEICNNYQWMNGEVAGGCDAILCFPGTFNEYGRRINAKTPCEECTYPGSAVDYGSTSCGPITAFDDRTILFELYDAAGGSSWTNSKDWKNDDVTICEWYGVTCEPKGQSGSMTVTELSLRDNNMIGIIPSIILHLPALEKLDLGQNAVSMTFNALKRAQTLQELLLDETRVSNLDGIGQASALTTLHLQKNSFGWTPINDDIFELQNLQILNMSESRLTGKISSLIGRLTSLVQLSLIGNELSGEIPSEFGGLSKLQQLDLSNNNFYGTLPASISGLSALKGLYLDNAKGKTAGVTGPLRPFANMPNLRELHLSFNQLTGRIPENFLGGISDDDANAATINVDLDFNGIVGTVPSQLARFRKLNIDLTDNLIVALGDGLCSKSDWLEGSVGTYGCDGILCPPGEFSDAGRQLSAETACEACPGEENSPYMGSSVCISIQKQREREILQALYQATGGENWRNKDGWMDDNQDICNWYGIFCKEGGAVESILLGSNNLVGTPPKEIFKLSNLKFLWLYSNPIDFSFEGIGETTSLQSLLLDSTGLNSLNGIGDAVSLVDLDIRYNQLKGKIPKEIENLRNLETFSASMNALTGPVPTFLGNPKLTTIRLGNNALTGSLPAYSTHVELLSIEVAQNKLAGSIPTNFLEIARSDQAIFLDFSENKLSGTVPLELGRFKDLTLYLRDNRIAEIHPGLCTLDNWNDGDVGEFQCDGILCPRGTSSPSGRASKKGGTTCNDCKRSKFLGSTLCDRSAGLASFQVGVFGTVVTILTMWTIML